MCLEFTSVLLNFFQFVFIYAYDHQFFLFSNLVNLYFGMIKFPRRQILQIHLTILRFNSRNYFPRNFWYGSSIVYLPVNARERILFYLFIVSCVVLVNLVGNALVANCFVLCIACTFISMYDWYFCIKVFLKMSAMSSILL